METGQPPDLHSGAGAALTRRTFVATAAAGIFAACSRAPGVTFGVQSYSFRDRPLDAAIAGMQKLGLKSCELWQGHIEPSNIPRDELRRWRETIELDMFHRVRDRFAKASIALSAYNISFNDSFSDTEIERGFEMAKALGAPVITSSSNVQTVARIAPVAARHKMLVGMHNHSRIDPNEFATAQSLTDALGQARSSPSTSTSATSPPPTKMPSRSSGGITTRSSRSTSRIANATRVRTSRSARATRRSPPC